MDIKTSNINNAHTAQKTSNANTQKTSTKFSDELKNLQKNSKSSGTDSKKESTTKSKEEIAENQTDNSLDDAIDGLNSAVEEIQNKDLNQSEENKADTPKSIEDSADNNTMIDNNMNIQDNKDILPQMNPNMNFSGNGQPFSSFMNNENSNTEQKLSASAKDLAEESAILSTMAENIAIANKNNISEKTVTREEGIKKVDTKTNITIENVVKFDNIVLNEADVEIFTTLVQNGKVDMNNLAPKSAEKSVKVSKTLADMLAKSMENNQPLRIDFDNNISVIIRISRDGKISADFLPSSQVAEAYLKENIPLLKQKFEQNNIDYDELNQRERKEQNRENNKKKKGQENE